MMSETPTPPTSGKLLPQAGRAPTVSANRELAWTPARQIEGTFSKERKSPPPKKKACEAFPEQSTPLLQAAAAGAELSMLLSKCAEVLSDGAAAERLQMKALDDILSEAKELQLHLQQKKKDLKRTLHLISDKLQA